MVSAIINLLAALFRAFPSFKDLVNSALKAANKANVAEAVKRKQGKDKAVDEAIGDSDSGNNVAGVK